ncbi:MBL fold metallo-hydrolase [Terasakiella brassicae]|uniref:MBL fold metallo-hydrolase n=1 Tax=Terasakiella brassicae TaxID=1634917 RepID=A0A917F444_9PROT|nr:MBL fold metallo-hydrolase [Terasakiella brassicae]GGF51339.1 MBL fold metallo-hydrolase [Terasakiella brassicae]
MSFAVKFWGVRGSIACPSPEHIEYGGNTSCIEVCAGEYRFILDAGTGIRCLGQEFLKSGIKEAHLLLTHTHWDHINGFPFFAPAYVPGNSFHVMAGHLMDVGGIRQVLASQMANPTFPVPLEVMQANLTFEDFRAGDSFMLNDQIKIVTAPLHHPNGATGYRIEFDGKSVCYVTDTEHIIGKPDQNILKLIEGADLVIYDSTYSDETFESKIGWGHSTWQEGIRLCRAAQVKKLAIFHHDPEHTDDIMHEVEEAAKAEWSSCFVAKERMVVEV